LDFASTSAGRRFLFASLYFAEGAPIGFLWWALPATLREAGAPVERITALTAMLALPWAVKFVRAPLIDLSAGRGRVPVGAVRASMFETEPRLQHSRQ
jgi:hypothetical protein